MTHKQPGRHEPPAWPNGNMGLGLCYSCVSEYWMARAARESEEGTQQTGPIPRPRYAITLAPAPKMVTGPDGTVMFSMPIALPTCLEHMVPRTAQAGARRPVQQQQPAPAAAPPTGRRWDRANLLP